MLNKFSIYNGGANNSFPAAAQEHLIRIAFKDQSGKSDAPINYGTIVGYMTSEFNYSSQGNYSNIYDIGLGNSLLMKIVQDETQRNFFNYGYATKKMYSNGPSPQVSVEFRCYAGTNNGYTMYHDKGGMHTNPVEIANALINATLPRVAPDSFFNNTNLSEQLVDGGKSAAKGVGEMIYGTANLAIGGFQVIGSMMGVADQDNAIQKINEAKANIKAGADKLASKKPPICTVEIGKIFSKDYMVVKSVEFKCSKEYLSPGVPLYGDYTVTFESLFNASVIEGDDPNMERLFGSGLNTKTQYNSRITFT